MGNRKLKQSFNCFGAIYQIFTIKKMDIKIVACLPKPKRLMASARGEKRERERGERGGYWTVF